MLMHQRRVIKADFDSTIRSTIWTGRPLRAVKTPYVTDWESRRADEMRDLQSKGIIVMGHEMDKLHREGKLTEEIEDQSVLRPMGMVAALVRKRDQPAAEIVRDMVGEAVEVLTGAGRFVGGGREARL
jgi:NAD(P)H-dependent flavin oxidoreductase YrpB (nitropropane dioxygenase family)